MLQIVHDVAPKARECFATAFTGDLGFADNIRALADPQGACRADVIVDDVGYFDEPFFSRGPISDAVDAVAAQGVHYFSSAGNGSSQQAYAAPLRTVDSHRRARTSTSPASIPSCTPAASRTSTPGRARDIAQSLVLGGDPTSDDGGSDGILDLQWDDPVDPNGAPLGDPLIDTTGEITAAAAGGEDPVRRHRRPDGPGDRRRDPVRLDGLHPHAQGPGREHAAGDRHRHRARRPSCRRSAPPAPTRSRSPASTATSATSRSRSSPCSAARAPRPTSTRCSSMRTATSCSPARTSTGCPASPSRSPASTARARCSS